MRLKVRRDAFPAEFPEFGDLVWLKTPRTLGLIRLIELDEELRRDVVECGHELTLRANESCKRLLRLGWHGGSGGDRTAAALSLWAWAGAARASGRRVCRLTLG